MIKAISSIGVKFPKTVVLVMLAVTAFMLMQLSQGLRWETDARVYLPKGHPAIIYDEKIDDEFGVKDNIIIGIVNDDTIYNQDTLERVKRIAEKIRGLDGVAAQRDVDIASMATAIYFTGDDESIAGVPLMPDVPKNDEEMAALKKRVTENADLFVGNIVSADGKATMIRAKLKEGMVNRYMTYFQIKGILAVEGGTSAGWDSASWGGGDGDWKKWQKTAESSDAANDQLQQKQADQQSQWQAGAGGQWDAAGDAGGGANPWWPGNQSDNSSTETETAPAFKPAPETEHFYLAGRPVIEVTSGIYALDDMKIMIPAIVIVMALVLLVIFRSFRGVLMPLMVMSFAIIWTGGLMVLLDVPLYTISTMLPVILVAVGIGDSVHLMSQYYDSATRNIHRSSKEIVAETMDNLGAPLIATTATTAIGFLALLFAEMPPFKVFAAFAILGIVFSWLITVTLLPAMLSLLKPHVANYYAKKRAQRVYEDSSRLGWLLVRLGVFINARTKLVMASLVVVIIAAAVGASQLFVNSSWLSDFRAESEISQATAMMNDKFNGTTFLHVVIEADERDTLKRPDVLKAMEELQKYAETLPKVGGSLSVVDYLKNMNLNLHSADQQYNRLPDTQAQIAEFMFLLALSGRPEQLDEVVDYNFKKGLISIAIKTDYTKDLKFVVDSVDAFVKQHFQGLGVRVNYAGSANNSYVWGHLLIGSQTDSIVISKLGIILAAGLIMMSLVAGIFVVMPVVLSTLLVAGICGFFAIPLDVSTALAAGIAIGVGVDYAIHYIFRYRRERKSGKNHDEATAETLRTAGRTIVLNATVVAAGFAVLFFSHFPPHVKLGYFVSAYMVISCLVAIVVLPALFAFFRPKFVEKVAD
ncbi:MAG: MMPL family transporter [Gammaproteobacteria bacterium]|nr:MMPL family transporter [Gammaproteobacteria bacterium]